MDRQVHTAVIGGGPAGAACGVALQRQGISNCIIDRAVFPRPKTCGGLMTEKTWQLLRAVFDGDEARPAELICNTVSKVTLFGGMTPLVSADVDLPLRLTDRFRLDHGLIRRYQELGGALLEGQRQYAIDYDSRVITLENGDAVSYRYLVFADGAMSRAHRDFGVRPERMGFCVETFLPGDALEPMGIEIRFDSFGAPGYLWVFPYGDRICVGLGSRYQKGFPYREELETALEAMGVSARDLEIRGAFLPCGWLAPQERFPDSVLLIGDAGGFVDPIYGEGLYFALLSGRTAGEAMAAEEPKEAFLKEMQPACRIIRNGNRLQPLLYSPLVRKGFINKIRGRSGFLKFYCDRQLSAYQYDHVKARIISAYRQEKKSRGA